MPELSFHKSNGYLRKSTKKKDRTELAAEGAYGVWMGSMERPK